METTVETTAPHTVKVKVEVPADEFGRDLDRTYRSIADQVKIPGFRKGKVPKQIIDTQIGRDAVLEQFVSSSVPGYFRKAVADEDLAPITEPDVDVQQIEPGKPFVFTATVEVRPRLSFEESDYTGLEVTKPPTTVADDELAKTASEFDTLDELKDDLRKRLGEVKEREALSAVRDLALQALIDTVDVDLPESLIEEETEHRILHAREQAERMGVGLEKMLEMQGWDEDRLREDSRDHAIRAIKSDLVLEGIARSANLEVTAEEIGAEISVLAQAYGRDPKAVAKDLERTGQVVTLAGDIIRSKALDLLVERADIETEHAGSDTSEP